MFKNTPSFSSFSVKDIIIAEDFYGDTLGLQVSTNKMGMLIVTLASGATIMMYPKLDHQAATFTLLNFQVADLDKTVDKLIEKGIVFEQYDTEYMKTDEKGIVRSPDPSKGPNIAWFKDPSGNIIAVMED